MLREPSRAEVATLLDPFLRQDLASFIAKSFSTVSPGTVFLPNWHIEAIAWHVELVRLGHIRRLIIAMPPRSLSRSLPRWLFPIFSAVIPAAGSCA